MLLTKEPITRRAVPARRLPGILLLLLLLLGAPDRLPARAVQVEPGFSPVDCSQVFPQASGDETVTCGYLSVPQVHSQPEGPTLDLAVVILQAIGPDPVPDALFLNQGGPGYSSIDTYASLMYDSRLRQERDLVIFDQRGTGHSHPALDCPEIFEADIDALDEVLDAQEINRRYNQAALLCRDRLLGEGLNLAAYNSLENAHDVEALRQALRYEQINLYGVSYGALLALHTLREHPGGLRSVILDSVMPPQRNLFTDPPFSADLAFTRFFQECDANPECASEYPDLEGRFFRLVKTLNDQPADLELIDLQTGGIFPASLTGDDFLWTVFQALYASEIIPLLPEMIRTAEAGDFNAFESILSVLQFDRSGMLGMYWSVNCAEDGAFDPAKVDYSSIRPELAKDQTLGLQAVLSLCREWGPSPLDPSVNASVSSDVPTLIFSGHFDPITPLEYAQETAAGLSRSQLVTFRNAGHGILGSSECGESLMAAFLKAPALPLDTRCAQDLPPLDFKDSRDYVAFPFISLLQSLFSFRVAVWIGLLLLLPAWILLLSSLAVVPLGWLLSKIRPPREAIAGTESSNCLAGITPGLTVLAAACSLGLVGGLGVLLFHSVASNDAVLLFGLPGPARFFLWLAPVIVVLALLMVVGTIFGLFDRNWSLWRKIYHVLVSLAAFVIAAAMAAAGWMTAWF